MECSFLLVRRQYSLSEVEWTTKIKAIHERRRSRETEWSKNRTMRDYLWTEKTCFIIFSIQHTHDTHSWNASFVCWWWWWWWWFLFCFERYASARQLESQHQFVRCKCVSVYGGRLLNAWPYLCLWMVFSAHTKIIHTYRIKTLSFTHIFWPLQHSFILSLKCFMSLARLLRLIPSSINKLYNTRTW